MTVIDIIYNKLSELSNKQKHIGRYLIKNRNNIGFMSLKELSEEINVSEVTILNFCKSIDVESFTELRRLFQELIKKQLYVPDEIKSSLQEINSLEDAYNNTIQIQKLNFDKVIRDNSIDIFKEIIEEIRKADNVYICGQGMSKIVAEHLNSRLRLININSKIIEIGDIISSSVELARLTEKDCFILISFPKYSWNVIGLSKYLYKNNYKFISITDSKSSPIAKGTKHILKCQSDSLVFHNFISSVISLIEIFLVMLSFNMKDDLIKHLDNLEEIRIDLRNKINNE